MIDARAQSPAGLPWAAACALLLLLPAVAGCEEATFGASGLDAAADVAAESGETDAGDAQPDGAADAAPEPVPPDGEETPADPCDGVACGAAAHCAAGACVCDDGYEGDPVAGCTPEVPVEQRVRSRLVEIARAEIGFCEGVDDRPYMLAQPGMWCYDFVAWVYEQADYPLPTPLSLPEYAVGSLPAGWRPEPGDLVKFTYQHYGMVSAASTGGTTVQTIEGNYGHCVVANSTSDAEVAYYGSLDTVF